MRRLVLNIAISLDGYICRKDGRYDWIRGQGDNSLNTELQFDNEQFFKSCDTIIIGHEALKDCPIEDIPNHNLKTFVVASRTPRENKGNLQFTTDILSVTKKLKQEDGSDIWLYGGAKLADNLIKEDLIDEYIIGIIPTILGEGRRLFAQPLPELPLKLVESTVVDGIVMLRYQRRL